MRKLITDTRRPSEYAKVNEKHAREIFSFWTFRSTVVAKRMEIDESKIDALWVRSFAFDAAQYCKLVPTIICFDWKVIEKQKGK